MREEIFFEGEYFHIYNRGVDKRMIFMDDLDRQRFYWSLYLFNDSKFDSKTDRLVERFSKISVQQDIPEIDTRDRLVDIGAFNLLGNHFHLLVRPRDDEALTKFMHRISVSYSKYFNRRHGRVGGLLEKPFGAVSLKQEAHLEYVPIYIHLNTLDLFGLPWRDGVIHDWGQASDVLNNHPWSSHAVYKGSGQALPVVDPYMVKELYPDPNEYEATLRDWSGRYVLDAETQENKT